MNVTTIPADAQAPNQLRMAAYCRVSSDSADQKNSYAAQVKFYTEFIASKPEWLLADIFADEGLTGTRADKRDDFQRMLADCKRGKIDRILCKSVSRFARNTADCLTAVRLLKGLGVTVLFEDEGIDTADMKDEFWLTMQGMVAQGESQSISQNLRWGYQRRMQAGEFLTCNAPFGYKLVGSSGLEIVPEEAEVVRRIFAMHLAGLGRQKICDALNAEQAAGRRWDASSLRHILRSEKYIGHSLVQKTFTTDTLPYKKMRNQGQQPQFYIENSHEPIIDQATFEAAQRLQAGSKTNYRPTTYPLTGKLRCPDCGATFRRQVINGKARWMCTNYLQGKTACTPLRIFESAAHEAFLLLINKLIAHRAYLLAPLIEQLEALSVKANGTEKKVYQIDQQLAGLTAQNLAITRLYNKGILDGAAFTAQTGKLSGQIAELRAQRRAALRINDNDDQLNELRALNDRLAELEFQGDFDAELFRAVVQRIVPGPTELKFTLPGGLVLTEAIPNQERRWKR
ncbi:MAG: recombinase family protein [Oscillospiraceae bacterium]|jgi:DNA invertase Pin-like site-specific DNA recombinase|nr:recombinase family protein [Oscillospiraceae bacterium]